jgi:hypothetical protein
MWKRLRMGWLRDVPASKLALALPPAFLIIWIVLLVFA